MSTIGQAIVSKDDKKLPNAWSRFKGMHRLINSLIHFNGKRKPNTQIPKPKTNALRKLDKYLRTQTHINIQRRIQNL